MKDLQSHTKINFTSVSNWESFKALDQGSDTIKQNSGKQNNDFPAPPSSKDVYLLISGICEYVILHGKMHITDVIKVTDLEVGK